MSDERTVLNWIRGRKGEAVRREDWGFAASLRDVERRLEVLLAINVGAEEGRTGSNGATSDKLTERERFMSATACPAHTSEWAWAASAAHYEHCDDCFARALDAARPNPDRKSDRSGE